MKYIIKNFLIGGVIGFFVAMFILMMMNDMTIHPVAVFNGLAVIIVILIGISLIFILQIMSGIKQDVSGEEEDELDRKLYIKSSDTGMLINSTIIFSIILLSMSIIESLQLMNTVIAILLIFAAVILQYYQSSLYMKMYPERDMPSMNDPDYAEKLVNIADDGERFVILQGMMKAYNMYTLLLIVAIIISTIYSLFSEEQQMFSIVLMGLILIVSNGAYFITIRKKA